MGYPDGGVTPLSVFIGLLRYNYRSGIRATCTSAEHLAECGKAMGKIANVTDSLSIPQALDSADLGHMIHNVYFSLARLTA